MATLIPTLTLTSTDISSDTLSLSVSDSISVGSPISGVSSVSVSTTGAQNIIVPAADTTKITYIKHTGVDAGGNAVNTDLKIETTGDVMFAQLNAGEFCYFPHNTGGSTGVQLEASSGTIVAEYAYFTHT